LEALKGIRIVDLTVMQLGPIGTRMLADLGAEVVHIENRETGDMSRGLRYLSGIPAQLAEGRSLIWELCNINKKSLAIDLKKPEGRQVLLELAAHADVFVHNLRPRAVEALGLSYEHVRAVNQQIVYVAGSGYGSRGPERDFPAYDYLGQARSGFMSSVGPPDAPPTQTNSGIADQIGGIMLSYAILLGLLIRSRTGRGQYLEVSHLGSMMWLQMVAIAVRSLLGRELPRLSPDDAASPLWNHYECADGKWIAFAILQSDRYWPVFCRAIGREDLGDDPRFRDSESRRSNRRELIVTLQQLFRTRPRDEWLEIIRSAPGGEELPVDRVQTFSDLLVDPQVWANDYLVEYEHPFLRRKVVMPGFPIFLSETPAQPRGAAPEFGQHTEEVLQGWLGYQWDQIEELRAKGVI
jgi:crotonobetainyl-CoA:carnitine CoA-transferase CaiB-like acyl-CoA transferase